MPSTVLQLTSSWPGITKIKNLFVFGDSYSSVLAAHYTNRQIIPTPLRPFGVTFPGEAGGLWNEHDMPNWVGHFITKYRPGPRYKPNTSEMEQDPEYLNSPLLVFDYALGGNTVNHIVNTQLSTFLKGAGVKPDWAPWLPEDSLFVTWIGINDCAFSKDHDASINKLFTAQEELYETGARNFLFIDVPPVQRTPAVRKERAEEASKSFLDWNACLINRIYAFNTSHPDATVMLFSSYDTFTTILDDLKRHNLPVGDARKRGGAVWIDHLHPTSAMHDHFARYLADFLTGVS
ncbi:hypothetical protein BDZ89DRAFT_293474 [Hymenopellis radicata]|nr:hypothetical protein BDZ89DRAFT_293474 [Hymenopellis radicata]